MDNLNEEIKRIKKLFSEDLLWGNLIKEQGIVNPDTGDGSGGSPDGKIDATEFTASGDEISSQEAVSFLRNVDYAVQKSSSRENIAGTCFNDKTLNETYKWLLNKPSGWDINDYKTGFNSNSGICYLYIQGPDVRGAVREIQKLNFWSDEDLTFLFKLEKDIVFLNEQSFSATSSTVPGSAADTLVKSIFITPGSMNKIRIKYVRYKCKYDPTLHTYNNMEFAGFFNTKKARVMETVEETISEGLRYKGDATISGVIQGAGISILEIPVGSGTVIPLNGDIIKLLKNIRK